MTTTRDFQAVPTAAAEARRYANAQMSGSSARAADVVELLVSELASNAVTHARTSFTVCLQRNGQQVRVEVTDAGGGQPQMRPLDPSAPNGRGLQLLEALADSWGVETHDAGKTVWFVVSS